MVTVEDMVFSLKLMGIEEGDTLLCHGALSAIGSVEGGAQSVIAALLEAVGESGTLCMCTLSGWGAPFDPENTPSGVGALSETLRRWKGARRSLHPVHSVAAVGRLAEYMTAGHEKCETGCGAGTPFEKLEKCGGKIVLIGVDMGRNTSMHAIEERADAKYLLNVRIPAPMYVEGYEDKTFLLRKFPPGHRDFPAVTYAFRRSGVMTEGLLGRALTKVIDARGFYRVGEGLLRDDPAAFLCGDPACVTCEYSRKLLAGEYPDMEEYRGRGCGDPDCEVCSPLENEREARHV